MRFELMNNGVWYCYSDDESPAHEDELKGTIGKADDGFWRFYPQPMTALTCSDIRKLADKLSALNMDRPHPQQPPSRLTGRLLTAIGVV
jgi:hypothetical protein